MEWFLIFIFGGAGSLARALLAQAIPASASGFPSSTLFVNLSGSFFIGVVLALASSSRSMPPYFQQMAAIGFLGGFTTFSAFSWQTLELLRNGQNALGIAYLFLSPVIALACTYVGYITAIKFG